jgi:Fe-Mn family superoxide dismutase
VDASRTLAGSAADSEFESGWAWLVLDGDKLKVVKTTNAWLNKLINWEERQ